MDEQVLSSTNLLIYLTKNASNGLDIRIRCKVLNIRNNHYTANRETNHTLVSLGPGKISLSVLFRDFIVSKSISTFRISPRMELMTEDTLRTKSDSEIITMTRELQEKAKQLADEHRRCEDELRIATDNFRKHLPNVPEVQRIAQERLDLLDRKRRLEKKIVAVVNRYPTIIEGSGDKPAILSKDVSILKRQLELLVTRREKATKTINEFDKKREDLERKMAELKGETRRSRDILERRQRDKNQLIQNLKKEQDTSTNMYSSERRTADKRLALLNQRNLELEPELRDLKAEYENLQRIRLETLGSALPANAQASQTLMNKRQALLQSLNNFLTFWRLRRLDRFWADRQDFLADISGKTNDRRGNAFNSIRIIQETNKGRLIELDRHRTMIREMERKCDDLNKKNASLQKTIDATRSRITQKKNPMTPAQAERIQQLSTRRDKLEFDCRSIEFEVKNLESGSAPTRSERCFAHKREEYRKDLEVMSNKLLEVRALRDEFEQMGAARKQRSLQNLDVQCVWGEENKLTFVQAADIQVLASLLFHPGNIDKYFIPGFLVLMHTEKAVDYQEVAGAILRAYEKTEFTDIRTSRLKQFMNKLSEWFGTAIQDPVKKNALTPLFNAIGSSGVIDIRLRDYDDVIWDRNVPFNDREESIVFCATPEILVEHFSYFELQILRKIPPHEFMGTGWAAVDKCVRAPHIVAMVDHFNTITQWIVESVVITHTMDQRVKLIERWLKVMQAAREMRNFQLVFEIFGALCSPAVAHLEETRQQLSDESQKILKDFRQFTTPTGRFEQYRKELASFVPEIVVPYIGPMLTSLVYIADGNPSKKVIPATGEAVCNFSKYRSYAHIMADICGEWGTNIKFILNPDLFKKVSSISPPSRSEPELFEAAQKLESGKSH